MTSGWSGTNNNIIANISGNTSGNIAVGNGIKQISTIGTPQSVDASFAKTILILAANPRGTTPLRLDQEVRDISEGLQRAQKRDQFVLEQRWAVRPRDIQRAMLDINPNIAHFAGQSTDAEGLMFEDETGQVKTIKGEVLANLFQLFSDRLECVFLNGCYSESQVKAIANHVNYVVGIDHTLNDQAAIEFAVGFYDALGAGRSIEFAYKLGCSAIQMAGITGVMPTLTSRK